MFEELVRDLVNDKVILDGFILELAAAQKCEREVLTEYMARQGFGVSWGVAKCECPAHIAREEVARRSEDYRLAKMGVGDVNTASV